MKEEAFSYKTSGVDVSRTDKLKAEMADILETKNDRVLNRVGAFASLYDFKKFAGIKHPVLVLKAEEPGSKQKLAIEYNKVRSVCFDMINHLVNDIAVMGAKPLAVLDTIVTGSIDEQVTKELVHGIADACKANDCDLVGGETSIQPGILPNDTFVLTSSIVGVVDKDAIVDGSKVKVNDVVLAVASNGLHTNGYTLIRTMMEKLPKLKDRTLSNGMTFLDAIMLPHTPYYKLLDKLCSSFSIKAMAHITGGGIEGNLCRVLPVGTSAEIDLNKLEALELFKIIKKEGGICEEEMLSTFNCGVGLVLIVDKDEVEEIISLSKTLDYHTYLIGTVRENMTSPIIFKNHVTW